MSDKEETFHHQRAGINFPSLLMINKINQIFEYTKKTENPDMSSGDPTIYKFVYKIPKDICVGNMIL